MVARETVLQRIQRTCQEAVLSSVDLAVDEAAAAAAAGELPPPAEIAGSCQFTRLPIRFDSQQAEVNAMALLHLLDFGSGFDDLLLAKTRKDAHETVQYGLLGMLMHGAPVHSRAWLAAFSAEQVYQYFGIDATVDEPVPGLPGVTLSRAGPLAAFTTKLREAVSEAGKALADTGHVNLGELILSNLDAQVAAGQPPSAAALVEDLVDSVPGFCDVGLYRGAQVCFHRKAQALAAQLHLRFRGQDARFRFADMDQLTADSGNVLPAVFRRLGVLRLSSGLAQDVDSGKDLQGDERERAIRAGAVVAAAAICRAAAAAAATLAAGAVAQGAASPAATDVQPWQLSMFLLHREERAQRERQQGQAQPAPSVQGVSGVAGGGIRRHVAKGTLAY